MHHLQQPHKELTLSLRGTGLHATALMEILCKQIGNKIMNKRRDI